MKISGIYKIESVNHPERIYIGSSYDVQRRWFRHKQQLFSNEHHSKKLQRHYNKHGLSDLIFIIIEPCFPEFLIVREQHYLNKFKPYFNGSLIAGSTKGLSAWNKGKKGIYSEDTIEKMRNKKVGKPLSKEHRLNISRSEKGKESKLKGIKRGKHTPEHNRKISATRIRLKIVPWNKGIKKIKDVS